MRFFQEDGASAIGIIGDPDEESLETIRKMTGKPVRKVQRNGRVKIIIGKGIRRKIIRIPNKETTPTD